MEKLLKFLRNDKGASAVEYGLLVALIAAVIVGAVTLLGGKFESDIRLCCKHSSETVICLT